MSKFNILLNSKGALVVPPENGAEIGKAILDLKNDPEKCSLFGESARKFVESHYNRRKLAENYLDLMKSMSVFTSH